MVACGDDASGPSEVVAVTVSPNSETIWVDGTVELTVTAYDFTGRTVPGATVEWTSTHPQYATVLDGWVTGVAEGITLVIATSNAVADTCTVEVVPRVTVGLCDGTVDATHTCHRPSGLEFLDITTGLGMTYDDMVLELEPGGQYSDYRYATEAEITALFEDADIQGVPASLFSSENWTPVNALIDKVGETLLCGPPTCGHLYRIGAGFTAEVMLSSRQIAVLQADVDQSTAAAYFSNTSASETTYGHWLVRDP
jgi:hypothetical protein